MPNIVPPNPQQPITDDLGIMQQVFRTWANEITRLDLIIGSGSPEGVVSAIQGRQYMDSSGTAGAILYIKRDAAIAGDDKDGWILV
jgi:hypothetical protein